MTCFLRASSTTVRFLNVVVALLQVTAGLNGVFSLTHLMTLDWAPVFISAYAMLVAIPLLLFECKCKVFQTSLRHHCGFLFHFYGRCGYLVFIALLDVGVPGGLGVVAALTIAGTIGLMLFLRCCGAKDDIVDEEMALTSRTAAQDYQALASSKAVKKVVKLASITTTDL
ncbi:hypothetical protein SPRG_20269 [Saprolegnia parasitica CBS 223.65]|uniref:Transmembrane protein n=1 Tax=Saprolegnia parasitica (strain CBS 223.65) TaxID=695850 RepID=A0A067CNJ9_SAPPC|nr:hypothetical protein SPRG_20269 [Saprolegnia parasitica CBS 223.65]KDO28111.1 hypothetical protein SPRG_20269 [Saprolegnia parasitica CBS 223.65]|eukprot:XP_012201252.1 hypothetical protein SPRG_20269 [Saprolegnia parasitica CBS 223.65]